MILIVRFGETAYALPPAGASTRAARTMSTPPHPANALRRDNSMNSPKGRASLANHLATTLAVAATEHHAPAHSPTIMSQDAINQREQDKIFARRNIINYRRIMFSR